MADEQDTSASLGFADATQPASEPRNLRPTPARVGGAARQQKAPDRPASPGGAAAPPTAARAEPIGDAPRATNPDEGTFDDPLRLSASDVWRPGAEPQSAGSVAPAAARGRPPGPVRRRDALSVAPARGAARRPVQRRAPASTNRAAVAPARAVAARPNTGLPPSPAAWRRPSGLAAPAMSLADNGRSYETEDDDVIFAGPAPPAFALQAQPPQTAGLAVAAAVTAVAPGSASVAGLQQFSAPLPAAAAPTLPHGRVPSVGLFRALHETPDVRLASLPAPTSKQLHSISKEAMLLLFDARRLAEITRPRNAQDDIKAAQFLKAQVTLGTSGWANHSDDADFHPIFYGCQVVFRPGQNPTVFGMLLKWAVPFAVDQPKDISKTQAWASIYTEAASLYPQLEAEVFNCRSSGREFNLPVSLMSKIRDLGAAYFTLRAASLLPMLAKLGNSALDQQASAAILGYAHQATTFPDTWDYIDLMIQHGALRQHGSDPALHENAARVAIARPLLIALLQGQTLNWSLPDLVQAHVAYQPSATLLHSTDFAKLALTLPAAAALAASLPAIPTPSSAGPGLRLTAPTPPAYTPPVAGSTLSVSDIQLGFRLVHGLRTHPLYFSGEYPVPLGWAPPPSVAPPAASPPPPPRADPAGPGPRGNRNTTLSIPTARPIIGASSPFPQPSAHPCDFCGTPGHAQYECPRRFAEVYGRALPGFTMRGEYDHSAWAYGDLVPAARQAMANYLTEFRIRPHRRFQVTTDHIAAGTAPPPPGP